MNTFNPETVDWAKGGGLVPAIIQDARELHVLMLGYMNREALAETLRTGRVTFYSRSRERLWTKGEESGHFLSVEEVRLDCDQDTLLIRAHPAGSTCHTGAYSCFGTLPLPEQGSDFLAELDRLIQDRHRERPPGSYTTRLFEEGINRIARKLGEEAVETVVSVNESVERSIEEAADLVYHLLVFLAARERGLADVVAELQRRHRKPPPSRDRQTVPQA